MPQNFVNYTQLPEFISSNHISGCRKVYNRGTVPNSSTRMKACQSRTILAIGYKKHIN